jgi:glucose-1-phosphate cytidylyltransferase
MNQNFKVVILCGGLGTRIKEETEYRPKPMVEIGGRPILWHIMKMYSHYGFKDFILCLGYKGEMIKEYFYNYEILNNDFTIELGNRGVEFHNTHEEAGWRVTVVDTGRYTLKGARLKRVQKYIDTDTFMVTYGDGVANINIHELLKFHNNHGKIATLTGVYLDVDDSCDLEIGTLDKLAEEDELRVYKHLKDWMCMDTIRDQEYLNKLWASGKAFWINYR